jgi:hypothetical protein
MKGIFILLALVFISACKPELIEPSGSSHGIVINGLLSTDSLLSVNLSNSMYITDSALLFTNYISNASAYIIENGIIIDTMQYLKLWGSAFGSNYFARKVYPLPGHRYKILVKAAGMPDATAETYIPDIVQINKVDTTLITLKPGEYDEVFDSKFRLKCDIVFSDPANEKNFYLFYVYRSGDNSQGYLIAQGVNFQDPIVEENLSHGTIKFGIAFTDKSINGKQHRIQVTIDGATIGYPFWDDHSPFPHFKSVLYFRLYSITEDYYKYIHTLNLFFKNYNNPLGVPTQVFSNVTGGYGIFAGAAVSSDSIVFKY